MTEHEIDKLSDAIADKLKTHPHICMWKMTDEQAVTLKAMANAGNAAVRYGAMTAWLAIVGGMIAVFILGFKQKLLSWL